MKKFLAVLLSSLLLLSPLSALSEDLMETTFSEEDAAPECLTVTASMSRDAAGCVALTAMPSDDLAEIRWQRADTADLLSLEGGAREACFEDFAEGIYAWDCPARMTTYRCIAALDGMTALSEEQTADAAPTQDDAEADDLSFEAQEPEKIPVLKPSTSEPVQDKEATLVLTGANVLASKKSTVIKVDAAISGGFVWESSDVSIATVGASNGKVTAKAVTEPKDVTITARAKNNPELCGTHVMTIYPAATKIAVAAPTTSLDLVKVPTVQLTATVSPASAYDTLKWTTSNAAVATVDENGLVTAVGKGSVTIRATAQDGTNRYGSVKLTVVVAVEELTITGGNSVAQGKSLTLTAATTPAVVSNKTVTWTSSDPAVATVSSSGKVTGKALGTAIITATAKDGFGATASAEVTVLPAVTAVTIAREDGENATTIDLNALSTLQLTAACMPEGSSQGVTWATSNKKVATIDESGIVQLIKDGTVKITATAADGTKKKATLTLKLQHSVQSISIEGSQQVAKGKSIALKANVLPTDATNKAVAWVSADPAIATVSSSGSVKGKAEGTTTITATAKDGSGVCATHEVIVKAAVASVVLTRADGKTDNVFELNDGNTLQLNAACLPASAAQDVSWKTSDTKVATVDESGLVTAVKAGNVTITATATDGTKKSASIKLIVRKSVQEIVLSPETDLVLVGEQLPLFPKAFPEDATDTTLTFTTSNKAIATVSPLGTVTGIGAGDVTITATAKDGSGCTASVDIRVRLVEGAYYRALVIGEQYDGSHGLKDLNDACINDATNMSKMLSGLSGTTYHVNKQTGFVSMRNMDKMIASTFAEATEDDVSLVYYSGHGLSPTGAFISKDDVSYSPAQLRAALDTIPGTKIVIVDACHSGRLIGKSAYADASDDSAKEFVNSFIDAFALHAKGTSDLADNNYYVITACRGSESSWSSQHSGYFTKALLEGCGWAVNSSGSSSKSSLKADTNPKDGAISMQEAAAYAERRTNELLYDSSSDKEHPTTQYVQHYASNGNVQYILFR